MIMLKECKIKIIYRHNNFSVTVKTNTLLIKQQKYDNSSLKIERSIFY
jgi:hypothetical protein